MGWTDRCPWCLSEGYDTAFVKYHASPNDAQMRTDWFDELPLTLYGLVCMECGMVVRTLDPRDQDDLPDFDELPQGTSAGNEYRVDEELK